MEISDLTPEQRAKAMACESADELLKLAEELGVRLTDEHIEAVSGGMDWGTCSVNDTCGKDFVW